MGIFREIEERITKLRNGGSRFSTERMEHFSQRLGNPQNSLKIIHIAGTNGKGSTCAMLDSILRSHGKNVGLFTSPHLLRINERVQINRKEISDEDFVRIFLRLEIEAKKIALENKDLAPTFFEYIAALAIEYFKEKRVDWAILETGLGGRLDATNIVNPVITAITSIGMDHMQYLGNSIGEIAAEKSGIIKKEVPVVCGIMPPEAMSVIEAQALKKKAPIFKAEDFFGKNPEIKCSLEGEYQKKNAALSLSISKILNDRGLLNFDESKAEQALANVRWDARWQKIRLLKSGDLILDCSHNEEGAAELEKNLKALCEKDGQKPVIATGILGKERAVPLLKVISKYAKKIIFLQPNEPRALSYEELADCLPETHPEFENATVEGLFPQKDKCSAISQGEKIVCTGSCYLAGEVLARVNSKKTDSLNDMLPPSQNNFI